MKIRRELIDQYLRCLTMGRGVNYPDPMSDLENFDADIRTMHRRAHKEGNLDWLRLALDSLIVDPNDRIGQFSGQQFPFDDHELVAIFKRAYETIWPDESLSEPGNEVSFEFVDMSAEDWDAYSNNPI